MVSANDAKLVIISKYANNMIKKIFISNESGQPKDIGIKDEVALGKAKDALKAAKLALDKAHAAIGKAFDVDAKLSNTTTTPTTNKLSTSLPAQVATLSLSRSTHSGKSSKRLWRRTRLHLAVRRVVADRSH